MNYDIEAMRERFRNSQRSEVKSMGINIENLSQNQLDLITEPNDAPENFYHDGEVSSDQAFKIWVNKLKNAGIPYEDIIKASKHIFNI